ncbi:MAG: GNAT family N-acetyltransferase [Pseudomonadota bacterium]
MTPDQLAAIHAQAMDVPAPWSAANFAELIDTKGVFTVPGHPNAGFALGRVIADEAELLTLAVMPSHQRKGIGAACLAAFESTACELGATIAHLEVATSNLGARSLYEQQGWTETGRRPGYFRGPDGRIDAILMQKRLSPA